MMERDKQIHKHGYDVLGDVKNTTTMALTRAALTYIFAAQGFSSHFLNNIWPWKWKKKYIHNENEKGNLIKAGALIAAALDRMNAFHFAGEPKLFFNKIGKKWTVSGYILCPGDEWVTEVFQSQTAPTRFIALKKAKEEFEYRFKYERALYTDGWYDTLQQTYKVVVREYEKYKSKTKKHEDYTQDKD